METMAAEEKQRVEQQKKSLGEEGLAEKAKQLKTATEDNEVNSPPSLPLLLPLSTQTTLSLTSTAIFPLSFFPNFFSPFFRQIRFLLLSK
jgi:hypothetical protein